MSTNKPSVGRQSASVYRRRRAVALLVLLAVILAVVLLIARPWSSSGDARKSGAVTTGTASPSPSATTTPASTPGATPTPTATPTAKLKAGAPCLPSNVDVKAVTDKSSYAAGEDPKLSLSLTNTGPVSCSIDAGTAKQLYTITSGSETYWKSTDCQTSPTSNVILLVPGKTVNSTTITWDRTRSDPSTCNEPRPSVPAAGASYHLTTAVDGITSKESSQFLLY
jgi:hypothetical protein